MKFGLSKRKTVPNKSGGEARKPFRMRVEILENATFEEVIGRLMSAGKGASRVLYRGVGDSQHMLIPKIGRITPKRNDCRKEERRIFEAFRREAVLYCQVRPADDFEWLVLAQHHGLATRLLDWTKNPLVALYFAVEQIDSSAANNTDCAVYALRDPDRCRPEEFRSPFSIQKVVRLDAPQLTPRIAAQSGVFTIHPEPKQPYIAPRLTKFVIERNLRRDLKDHLYRCGIHCASLFPDLDHLSQHIVWRRSRR